MNHPTCKTCQHWQQHENWDETALCAPRDPDTREPMNLGFEVRICRHPSQAFHCAPVDRRSFALADASTYYAVLATAEDFGCVLHEAVQ